MPKSPLTTTLTRPLDLLRDLVPEPGAARPLAALTFAQSLGTGLFLTSSVIFFTRTAGFSADQLAIAMSIAGVCGFLCSMPAGRIADRFGARVPLAISYALLGPLFFVYPFVDNVVEFAVVAALIGVCETGAGGPLRGALIHALFGKAKASGVRAQMRSLFNLGFTGGAALAGLALADGSRSAFIAITTANAVLQLSCAVIAFRLRTPAGMESAPAAPAKRSWVAIKDRRFLLATGLSGVLEFYLPVLTVGMPLWIVHRTGAPGALTAVLIALNTIMVVLFQRVASRGSETVHGSGRLLVRAGVLLAVACVLFALSGGRGAVWATVFLVPSLIALTLGELAQASGSWGLAFALPPPDRMGEYQGVFALARGFQQFLGPALVTVLTMSLGASGWLILAALFLVTGLAAGRAFTRQTPSDPAASIDAAAPKELTP
ncbi:MFS transporter [Streptomyces sp. NPDC059382]|uniref:MFS transporter n=1 Tax=Streptomyces sp. NPDC059382 TaxID=3346816 RepID=UPI0036BC375A